MPLWGKTTDAENRPKWMPDDGDAPNAREYAFATTGGWAIKPGVKGTGNGNTDAQAEVLACLSGATGSTLSATMGEANVLSVDWDATTTLAHDGTGTFDMVFTCDEALTVTSAAYAGGTTETNHWYFTLDCLGPTDMISDGNVTMQYYSGSGTNQITFRGQVPVGAVTDGYLSFQASGSSSRDCEMITNGTSAVVDGNGTTITWADQKLFGSSADAGVDHSSSIFGTAITKTASSVNTLTTQAGSSSGTTTILTGVQFA